MDNLYDNKTKLKIMRKIFLATSMICISMLMSCENSTKQAAETEASTEADATGQSGVQDNLSQKNVVQVAIGSKDHTTLVTAIQAAKLVDAIQAAFKDLRLEETLRSALADDAVDAILIDIECNVVSCSQPSLEPGP